MCQSDFCNDNSAQQCLVLTQNAKDHTQSRLGPTFLPNKPLNVIEGLCISQIKSLNVRSFSLCASFSVEYFASCFTNINEACIDSSWKIFNSFFTCSSVIRDVFTEH